VTAVAATNWPWITRAIPRVIPGTAPPAGATNWPWVTRGGSSPALPLPAPARDSVAGATNWPWRRDQLTVGCPAPRGSLSWATGWRSGARPT